MQNKVLLTVISIFVTFGLLSLVYVFLNSGTNNASNVAMIKPNDHVKWAAKSKNVLIEYSDFQCPACKVFHDELKKIEMTNAVDITQNITFVFRHYPLTQHKNAPKAAYAAEAAGRQNNFFSMSDALFSEVDKWEALPNPENYFIDLAKKLKLDINKFKTDMTSSEVRQKVQDDMRSADSLGLRQTPTFFLNGQNLGTIAPQELINTLQNTAKQTK